MTDRGQGPESKPEDQRGDESPEVREFLREFAEFAETEDLTGANDFLDIGLPTAAGAARSAAEMAQIPEVSAPDVSESSAPAVAEPKKEPKPSLGSAISQRQMEALLKKDVVGASLPDTRFEEAPAADQAAELRALVGKLDKGAPDVPDTVVEAVSQGRVSNADEWIPDKGAVPAADEAKEEPELDLDSFLAQFEQVPAEAPAVAGEGPEIQASPAKPAQTAEERIASPEDQRAAPVAAAELSDDELMAMLTAAPAEPKAQGPVALEQGELDALAADRARFESEAEAESEAAPAFEEDESGAEEPVQVIQVGGRGGLLGLPVAAWAAAVLVPLVLVVGFVGFGLMGRPASPKAPPAEEVQATHTAAVVHEATVATSTPEAVVEKASEEHEAEAKASPVATPMATATPVPAPTATPKPVRKLPQFVFGDPEGDGIAPSTGLPKQNVHPQADIVNLRVVTTGADGKPGTGAELTDDGYAGPVAALEVVLTVRGSLDEIPEGSYRIDLFGRFKNAAPDALAPDGLPDLAGGSQVAFTVRHREQQKDWAGEQVNWNKGAKAPVKIGEFRNFAIAQNRVQLTIPAALIAPLMREGLDRDDFQFFVRVEYVSKTAEVRDEVGREALLYNDAELVALRELLATGRPTRTPEETAELEVLQLKLVKHLERRVQAMLNVVDARYLFAEPVAH